MIGKADQKVIDFFDEFVGAFKSFDGSIVAQRYFQPFTAIHADETVQCMFTSSETASYFQGFLDDYYASGCRSCSYKDLEVVPIGATSVLATVTWELYDDDLRIVSSWRESYIIANLNKKLLVISSIDHASSDDRDIH